MDASVHRTSLREFQIQLLERVKAARSGTQTHFNQLGVILGSKHYLLDLRQLSEIMPIAAIKQVPLARDWYLGLSNIRGNLIGVIDFSRFQGDAFTPITQESRVVAFAPGLSLNCALLVSRIMGLRNVAEMTLQSNVEQAPMPWISESYLDRELIAWTKLDLSLLVQEARFLHISL